MSTTQSACTITLPAEGNLKDKLYHALTLNSNGRVEEANAATELVVGILFIDPNRDTADDDPVTVMDIAAGGIGLVKAQSAITAGQLLVPTTTAGKVDGKNKGSLNNDEVPFGIALEAAAAADEIIRFKAGYYSSEKSG